MTLQNIVDKTEGLLNVDDDAFIVLCANGVIAELVEEYVDIKTEESVVANNGRIAVSALSKPLKRIFSVTKNGKKVKFCEFPSYVSVEEDGEYTVVYSRTQPTLTANSDIDLPPRFTVNVLTVGVVAEYYYRKGFFTEAESYRTRYLSALRNLERTVKSIKIGKRI